MIDYRDGNFAPLFPPFVLCSWCFPPTPHRPPILRCPFPLLQPIFTIFTATLRFLLTFSHTRFSRNPFERKSLTWWKRGSFRISRVFFSSSLSFFLSVAAASTGWCWETRKGKSAAVMGQFAAECPFKCLSDAISDCLTVSLPAAAADALGTLEAGTLWVNDEAAQPSVCSVSSDGAENRNYAATVLTAESASAAARGPLRWVAAQPVWWTWKSPRPVKTLFLLLFLLSGSEMNAVFSHFLHPSTGTVSNVLTKSCTLVFSM